jgi:negative regulator of sigma-B (phosphoserine phosphatase)
VSTNQSQDLSTIDCASFVRPCVGERVSGDAALVERRDGTLFVALVDALGHGPEAHVVARQATSFLQANWTTDVVATMLALHDDLRGTRGAVAGLGSIEIATGDVRFAGVGNTEICTLGPRASGLFSVEGLLGSRIRTPREQQLRLGDGEVLVLHSDGISSHFRSQLPQGAPSFSKAASLARTIVHSFGKKYDDASCVVAIRKPAR